MPVIEVELPDGNVVEFPEGTSQEVMQKAILGYVQRVSEAPSDVPAEALPPSGAANQQSEPISGMDQFIRDIPALAGGIAGPMLVASKAAQMAPVAGRALLAGAAGVGGVVGEAGQIVKEKLFGDEQAPETVSEASIRVAKAGAEQAAFEGVGQLAVKIGSTLVSAIKPSISTINKVLVEKFRGTGGELTPAQVTDSWWLKQLDSLSRGSLTGSGIFKLRDTANEAAFNQMRKNLAEDIAGKATGKLSDEQIGNLFLNTVKGGRSAHSDAAKVMYSELDDLAGAVQVPTTTLKQIAEETGEKLSRIAGVGGGEVNQQLIKQISNLPEVRTFADVHFLRSNLLSMQRDLTGVVGSGPSKKLIGDLVAEVNAVMDSTAKAAGGGVLEAYTKVNKFYQTGKKIFDNDFIGGLVVANKKNPERIGEVLFRDGNVKEIAQARLALKASSKLNKTFDADTAWHEMQSGYLQTLLTKTADGNGVVSSKRLLKTFIDRKKNRTLEAVFTKEQRGKIREFALIGEKFQQKPEAGLGMVMNLAQAGTIAGLVGFQVIDPTEAAIILLSPRLMAKALTSPKLIDLMITATKTKAHTTLGRQVSLKLGAEIGKIKAEMGVAEEDQQLPALGGQQQ